MKLRWSVAGLPLALMAVSGSARAQERPAESLERGVPAKTFCFHPRPLAACRNFAITETGLGSRGVGEDAGHVFWELGAMRNVSGSTALGGSLYSSAGADFVRLGAKARYRRWLSDAVPLDLAPGLMLHDADDVDTGFELGFTAHAALSFRDVAGAFVQLDVVDARRGIQPQLRVGVRAGSVVGALSGLVLPYVVYLAGHTAD